jgi:hypothetical protein
MKITREDGTSKLGSRYIIDLYVCMYVCMYKGWAIKLALAPRPLMIYCASPLTDAMIITVAALSIVLVHGSKPTQLVSSLLHSPQYKRHTCYSSTAWSWTVDYH